MIIYNLIVRRRRAWFVIWPRSATQSAVEFLSVRNTRKFIAKSKEAALRINDINV